VRSFPIFGVTQAGERSPSSECGLAQIPIRHSLRDTQFIDYNHTQRPRARAPELHVLRQCPTSALSGKGVRPARPALTSVLGPSKFPEHIFFRSFKILVRAFSPLPARIGKRVQIPRCRATVSEENAAGHWEPPGKAGGRTANCSCKAIWSPRPSVLTREARRPVRTATKTIPFACQGGLHARAPHDFFVAPFLRVGLDS
jgi:hypothetical protein